MSVASTLLMIRPASFSYNDQTAANNYFQEKINIASETLQQYVLVEFDAMVRELKQAGIEVIVINDTPEPQKPSAIFPNNWLSTTPEGKIIIYPMFAQNRRLERRADIIQQLENDFIVQEKQNWSGEENEGRYLEGTGSLIIDHTNKIIYAAISERTNLTVLEKVATKNNFQAIAFLATDEQGRPVYHTNVLMTLGEKFCVLCEEAIEEEWELIAIRQLLISTGHTIIPISRKQMSAFAGNMLEVKNKAGEPILILSLTAYESLTEEQKNQLGSFAKLLPISVPTVEQAEGGSVRCMIAEIFLHKK
ncbi:MAG: amidinotransferase [Bacteroidetes bacterium]|nr:amidinotransferase [Bacteroidota bacterium]